MKLAWGTNHQNAEIWEGRKLCGVKVNGDSGRRGVADTHCGQQGQEKGLTL